MLGLFQTQRIVHAKILVILKEVKVPFALALKYLFSGGLSTGTMTLKPDSVQYGIRVCFKNKNLLFRSEYPPISATVSQEEVRAVNLIGVGLLNSITESIHLRIDLFDFQQ